MPSLFYMPAGGSRPKSVQLFKRITTIGDASECDVSICDAALAETHANIHFDGKNFTISQLEKASPVFVNDKKVKSHRLGHKDQIKLGEALLTFNLYDEPIAEDDQVAEARLDAYRKMVEFSRQ